MSLKAVLPIRSELLFHRAVLVLHLCHSSHAQLANGHWATCSSRAEQRRAGVHMMSHHFLLRHCPAVLGSICPASHHLSNLVIFTDLGGVTDHVDQTDSG